MNINWCFGASSDVAGLVQRRPEKENPCTPSCMQEHLILALKPIHLNPSLNGETWPLQYRVLAVRPYNS